MLYHLTYEQVQYLVGTMQANALGSADLLSRTKNADVAAIATQAKNDAESILRALERPIRPA